MGKLKKYFGTVQFKTLGGFVIGFAILLTGSTSWVLFREGPAPWYYASFLISVMCFCGAVSSIFMIKYKEVPRPGLTSIKGTWAVIQGIFVLLISGFGFIYMLYEAVVDLLKSFP